MNTLHWVEHNLDRADDTVAYDETLLVERNSTPGPGVLRFWESSSYFVVLGKSNQADTECHIERCKNDGIPIIKRCSGGGTVLQGPGCLNYAFILPYDYHKDLGTISDSNCYIMKQQRNALSPLSPCQIKGYTDLAIDDIKFSGNAQRRLKHALLFHGTVLYNFDLSKINYYLDVPSREPDYRQGRGHLEFIRNFPARRDDIIEHIVKYWNAKPA